MRKIVFVLVVLICSLIGCGGCAVVDDHHIDNATDTTVEEEDTSKLNGTETANKVADTLETQDLSDDNQYATLDDASAEKMYFEAKGILSLLVSGGVDCDYNDSVEIDGVTYYRVTEEKYSDYESFLSLLRMYFTDHCIDELLSETVSFIEHEGKTYTDGGELSSNIHVGDDKYLSFSMDEDQAEIRISTEVLDDELLSAGSEEHIFILKLDDGYWRFDVFYLTNYQE